ncbi:hypothetical protein WN51_05497 [Melipona quadrifasciata]|uniref:Uncharacterized protein n=1 Tax=Melipona quadrifasciata TaxID=166423 RepID=A0A0N0BKI5_9HYME|nr:hypothetical protein WN51_05497 [Melipona quadrifasciata]
MEEQNAQLTLYEFRKPQVPLMVLLFIPVLWMSGHAILDLKNLRTIMKSLLLTSGKKEKYQKELYYPNTKDRSEEMLEFATLNRQLKCTFTNSVVTSRLHFKGKAEAHLTGGPCPYFPGREEIDAVEGIALAIRKIDVLINSLRLAIAVDFTSTVETVRKAEEVYKHSMTAIIFKHPWTVDDCKRLGLQRVKKIANIRVVPSEEGGSEEKKEKKRKEKETSIRGRTKMFGHRCVSVERQCTIITSIVCLMLSRQHDSQTWTTYVGGHCLDDSILWADTDNYYNLIESYRETNFLSYEVKGEDDIFTRGSNQTEEEIKTEKLYIGCRFGTLPNFFTKHLRKKIHN